MRRAPAGQAGPLLLGCSLLGLLVGTVGGVVAQVRLRRTPAVDAGPAWRSAVAWTGWVLLGAAAAPAVVCACALLGSVVIASQGVCGGGQMCGLGTALVVFGSGAAVAALGGVGSLLWWASRWGVAE